MKNTFLFVLSGEHGTLPLAELEAVLSVETDFDLLAKKENFAVYRTLRSGSGFLGTLEKRLAMTQSIYRFVGACYLEDIETFIEDLPKFAMPYRVRVHLYEKKEGTEAFEGKIGRMISEVIKKPGQRPSVNLGSPRTSIEFFISGNEVYCGFLVSKINKKPFANRRPKMRPFVKPVSIDPRTARLMVNLARAGRGRMLDPFCGTGGILIEAGITGLRPFGVDIDSKMVEGCKRNLEFFKIRGYVKEGDARNLGEIFGKNFFDCIVTDPPYGRLSSTKGIDVEKLYNEGMISMENVLKPGRFLTIAIPTNINIKTKMKLIEIHRERVNRSMERNIAVYQKLKGG